MKIFAGLFIVCSSLLAVAAHAHGGGLNAEGCHNNKKTGDYHCHRAPPEKSSQKASPPTGNPPTCFTGPKGGTYTITPSGRKNYNGC